MEFGPRALGNRSIIADPRDQNMQKNLNLKIKFRESFRPFAPSILAEKVNDWFELIKHSPYMLLVSKLNKSKRLAISNDEEKLTGMVKLNIKRSIVPAITHVDFSARVQTVSKKSNRKYYKLLLKFYELTNCPILVNTSFNIRGEPIVCTPTDAFRCFMSNELEVLVIQNLWIEKKKQKKELRLNFKNKCKLD